MVGPDTTLTKEQQAEQLREQESLQRRSAEEALQQTADEEQLTEDSSLQQQMEERTGTQLEEEPDRELNFIEHRHFGHTRRKLKGMWARHARHCPTGVPCVGQRRV